VSKNTSAEKLVELLGAELEVYSKILKLTEEQTKLLAKDDMDDIEAFNNSLDKRETLIEKIKGLHQEKDPLMQSYLSSEGKADGKNKDIENLIKQINEIIKQCAAYNDRNIAVMKDKTLEQTKRIDDQSSKRKGIDGYAQSVPNMPEVFDKKS